MNNKIETVLIHKRPQCLYIFEDRSVLLARLSSEDDSSFVFVVAPATGTFIDEDNSELGSDKDGEKVQAGDPP